MKNNDFDLSTLSDGIFFGNFWGSVLSSGWTVAVITLIVSALVTFTEIGFVGGFNENVTATVITLLFASYIIYFSTESCGERDGMKSEEYSTANREYKDALSLIRADDIYALREFCHDYAQGELRFRREAKLMRYGISFCDFEAYLKGEPGGNPRALRSVSRMKPKRLTPQMLLTQEGRANELSHPQKKRFIIMLSKLLPTTVCTFFTGAIVLAARDNLTAVTVIEGIIKLSALPLIAVKGYGAGYAYAKECLSVWLCTKTKLIQSFIKKRDAGCYQKGVGNAEKAT